MSGEIDQLTARVLTGIVGYDADGKAGRSRGYMRVFNPLDWAALGAAAGLETALDRLTDNGGGILYVPDGTWEVGADTLVMPSHSVLYAQSRATILKLAAGNYTGSAKACVARTSYTADTANLSDDVWFLGGTYDGNYGNATGGTEMEGINLIGLDVGGVIGCEVTNTLHDGIDIDYSSDIIIDRNWIHDTIQNGVHASTNNLGDIRVTNNLVEDCASLRVDQFRAGIDNDSIGGLTSFNIVKRCRTGIRVSGTGGSGSQNRIIGNHVYASTNNEPDIYVGKDGCIVSSNIIAGNEAAGQTQPRLEVQAASCAVTGNTIRGYPGIGIKVTGDRNLIGENTLNGFSQAATTGIQIASGTGNVIGVNAGLDTYATPVSNSGTATRAASTVLL